ncbi:unnamed protein product [Closterium sp. Naga37s-1]|nr:unnamed protein product [Closterium sp. Naga37s-1]
MPLLLPSLLTSSFCSGAAGFTGVAPRSPARLLAFPICLPSSAHCHAPSAVISWLGSVGEPSSSAMSRLPPPRAVGELSSSAMSRLRRPAQWGTVAVSDVAPSAAPHSGGAFVVGDVMPSAAPRSGGTVAVSDVAPSAAPRSGGAFVVSDYTPSAAPHSGETIVVGDVVPSAAPRSGELSSPVMSHLLPPRAVGEPSSPRCRAFCCLEQAGALPLPPHHPARS